MQIASTICLGFAFLLFQTDWGGIAGGAIGLVGGGLGVWAQIRANKAQTKLRELELTIQANKEKRDAENEATRAKVDETKAVLEAYKHFIDDLRNERNESRLARQICEKQTGYMQIKLLKSGALQAEDLEVLQKIQFDLLAQEVQRKDASAGAHLGDTEIINKTDA